jgi:hypothetical protein
MKLLHSQVETCTLKPGEVLRMIEPHDGSVVGASYTIERLWLGSRNHAATAFGGAKSVKKGYGSKHMLDRRHSRNKYI